MLECWNSGIMGLGYRNIDLLTLIDSIAKYKIDIILIKNHHSIIPLFHYSMIWKIRHIVNTK
jgi:hypothetical protein